MPATISLTSTIPLPATYRYPGPPISPDRNVADAWVYRRAPLLGEHCIGVLGELGYNSNDVERLFSEGVI